MSGTTVPEQLWYSPRLVLEHFKNSSTKLTLKAPITTAADDIHKYFSLCYKENKT